MSRTVHCARLGIEAEGLPFPPYPGELGQRIYAQVSKTAWQQWLEHQTLLINENRLNPLDPEAKRFLLERMERFLFSGEAEAPQGYVPPA